VAPREVTRHLAGLKHKLFAYQREGVARFLASSRLLLADDMGLGKTAQAIAACHVLFAAKRVARGLIVVPAALKAQWAREWQQFTDLALTVVEGSAAEARSDSTDARRAACCWSTTNRCCAICRSCWPTPPRWSCSTRPSGSRTGAAKTSAHVKQLAAPWRLVLTGTPMENRLGELSSILDWVDETALEPRWRLGIVARGPGRWPPRAGQRAQTSRHPARAPGTVPVAPGPDRGPEPTAIASRHLGRGPADRRPARAPTTTSTRRSRGWRRRPDGGR
jgi:hypothetical protein